MAGPWEKYGSQPVETTQKPWERYAQDVTPTEGIGRTIFDQAMQGGTFGLADEVSDVIGAGIASAVTGEPYGQLLGDARSLTAERQARQWEQNPGTSIVANLAGGLTTGVAGAAKAGATKTGAAVGNFLRSGNLPARMAKGAATGAASGGLYGFGSGQGEERWSEAGEGALLGTVGGAAIPAAVAGLRNANTRTIVPGADEIRKRASEFYSKAEKHGGSFSPEFTNKFIQGVARILPQTEEGATVAGQNIVNDIAERVGNLRGKNMSLKGIHEVDKYLGGRVQALLKAGEDEQAYGLRSMQGLLRNMVNDTGNDIYLSGGREGIEAINEGRKLFSAAYKLDDIEDIIKYADTYKSPTTAIQTGFRRLAKNAEQMGYSADEIALLDKASRTNGVTDALSTFGSRLNAIGGGLIGGPVGGVLGLGTSAASRAGATASQMSRANAAAKKVAERTGMVRTEKRLDPAKFAQIMRMAPREAQQAMREIDAEVVGAVPQKLLPAPETPKQLPAPQKDYVVDRAGNIHQASPQEQNRNITKRQRAESLGMSRDIYKVMDEYRARMGVEKTNELMNKYGLTKIGKFVAQNPYLRMLELDEATLRKMLDDIE